MPGYDFEAIRGAYPLDEFFASLGVELMSAGNCLKGRCPFHGEVNGMSLVIFPDDHWRCFGQCNVWGDVIDRTSRPVTSGTTMLPAPIARLASASSRV